MAVTVTTYGRFLESLFEGRVDVVNDEMWCMLVTSSYVFSQNSHKFKSIVVAGEVAGSGYTAGGQKITNSGTNYDTASKALTIPAGNLAWPSVTFSGVTGAVFYMKPDGLADSAMPLIRYINFGESISRSGEAFYLNMPASGVIKMTVP